MSERIFCAASSINLDKYSRASEGNTREERGTIGKIGKSRHVDGKIKPEEILKRPKCLFMFRSGETPGFPLLVSDNS